MGLEVHAEPRPHYRKTDEREGKRAFAYKITGTAYFGKCVQYTLQIRRHRDMGDDIAQDREYYHKPAYLKHRQDRGGDCTGYHVKADPLFLLYVGKRDEEFRSCDDTVEHTYRYLQKIEIYAYAHISVRSAYSRYYKGRAGIVAEGKRALRFLTGTSALIVYCTYGIRTLRVTCDKSDEISTGKIGIEMKERLEGLFDQSLDGIFKSAEYKQLGQHHEGKDRGYQRLGAEPESIGYYVINFTRLA